MLLFGISAFVLGFTAVVPLASMLLAKRVFCPACPAAPGNCPPPRLLSSSRMGSTGELSLPTTTSSKAHIARALSASTLFLWACLVWQIPLSNAGHVLIVLGFACLQAATVCDIDARIIPWELSLAASVFGLLFSLVEYGTSELALSLGLAFCALGTLETARILARRCGRPEPIGAGDLRLLPALFLFCGCLGSIYGAFAASVVMGLWAIAFLIRNRSRDVPHALPMAPGLSIWFLVGIACALL